MLASTNFPQKYIGIEAHELNFALFYTVFAHIRRIIVFSSEWTCHVYLFVFPRFIAATQSVCFRRLSINSLVLQSESRRGGAWTQGDKWVKAPAPGWRRVYPLHSCPEGRSYPPQHRGRRHAQGFQQGWKIRECEGKGKITKSRKLRNQTEGGKNRQLSFADFFADKFQ